MMTESDRSAERPPVVGKATIYFIPLHSMLHLSSRAARLTIGGLAGACAWPLVALAAPWLPEPLTFFIRWFLFTIGPGFLIAGAVTRELDRLTRVVVMLAVGSAAAPVAIDLLGRMHALAAFPFVASALGGALAVGAVGGAEGKRPAVEERDA